MSGFASGINLLVAPRRGNGCVIPASKSPFLRQRSRLNVDSEQRYCLLNMVKILMLPAALPILGLLLSVPAAAEEDLIGKMDAFLSTHCYECHDDLTTEADLDLTNLDFNPASPASLSMWELVFHRVEDGEMPPKKQPRPEGAELKDFLKTLKTPLIAADREFLNDYGRVRGRRLTRVEYEHAVQDLLGIDIPLADGLPADEVIHGFETEADQQQLSHFHLDKYLSAANKALDHAFERVLEREPTFEQTYRAKELTHRTVGNYRGPDSRDGKTMTWRLTLQFFGRMPKTEVPESGWYEVTIKDLKAINPGDDGTVWGTLRSGACASNEPILYPVGIVEATAKPTTQIFQAYIREGHMLEFKVGDATEKAAPSGATGGNVSFKGRDLRKEGFAGIEFDSISVKRIYPNGARWKVRNSLFPGSSKDSKFSVDESPASLERFLNTFATRAFRRPLAEGQIDPYLALAKQQLDRGNSFQQALKVGYRAILCSPRFLSFVEPVGKLDDYALASRLSFMLWSSLPDEELMKLAEAGKLTAPEVLAGEVDRLLDDPKSERFIANFTDQWLALNKIDFTTPDSRRFKTFDTVLQESMVEETRAFVSELIHENLGARHLVDSDFGMLNGRLKAHYGFDGVKVQPGGGLQKVSLPEDARSGLVTQGSVLKVTADGSVTSPILRGIWVNERILGLKTPPPPPNVPAVEPDIRGAVSIRDQLAKHSSDESCAACHAKIDPAGFALESYDPIGNWRSAYGTKKDSAKVDPSGVTPDGVPFKGIRSWKAVYADRPEMLAHTFAKHLLTYGTGAYPRFSDYEYLNDIVEASAKDNYGLRSILHAAVASPIFQSK